MLKELARVSRLSTVLTPEYLDFHGICPLEATAERLVVATWKDHVDDAAVDDLRRLFGCSPEFERFDMGDVRAAIARVYAREAKSAKDVLEEIGLGPEAIPSDLPIDDLRAQANQAPIIRLVRALLLEALEARASDVHLEAGSDRLTVRYRIDGVLHEVAAPPANLSAGVLSRIKIMADLDIAERRLPQDGRIRLKLQNRDVDVRVSTLPALRGESVVLRLLDSQRNKVTLHDVGMAPDTLEALGEIIARPHGMLLVTGPTGSGKTTTLYAALEAVRNGRQKIVTVEDPVEYELPGVTQVQVSTKIGLTFASALRALLRQDPDIVLVGEIRDPETASIAVHAALTGHLVLATLHTNSAAGALTRMVDLGVAPYLIGSTISAVLAQRLVRRVCYACNARVKPDTSSRCDKCRGTGYHGRTGLFELMIVDEILRRAVNGNAGAHDIHAVATAAGMRSLADDGARLVGDGVTTAEEVLRVAGN
jgi:general secretion pathway protein E